MIPYIFVAAALISVVPVLIIFKTNLNKLIAEPTSLPKVQKKFLIYVGLSKIIPVAILIFGMMKMTDVDRDDLIIPILIIVALLIYGLVYMSSQKKIASNDEDAQYAINTLIFVARPLIFSIPLMAIAFLIMMMT